MSSMNLPLEIYDILERKLGRDDAMPVAKAIEVAFDRIDERSYELAAQRKLEVKEELKVELRDELATKADIAELRGEINTLRGEIKADIAELRGETKVEFARIDTRFEKMDKKFTIYFMAIIFTIIATNHDSITLLGKILGLVK